jgi:hypothetical protein
MKFAAAGRDNPAKRGTNKVKTVMEGQYRTLSYVGDHAPVVVDEPPHLFGENTAPAPGEIVLSALGGCLAVGITAVATWKQVAEQARALPRRRHRQPRRLGRGRRRDAAAADGLPGHPRQGGAGRRRHARGARRDRGSTPTSIRRWPTACATRSRSRSTWAEHTMGASEHLSLSLPMVQAACAPSRRARCADQADAIDRGQYPREVLQRLGAAGAFAAHLGPAGDFATAVRAMAEVSAVCGATGFMVWCQQVCGLLPAAVGQPGAGRRAAGAAPQRRAPGRHRHEQPDEGLCRHRAAAAEGHAGPTAAIASTAPCPGSATWGPTTTPACWPAWTTRPGRPRLKSCSCCAATRPASSCATAPASARWKAPTPGPSAAPTCSSAR